LIFLSDLIFSFVKLSTELKRIVNATVLYLSSNNWKRTAVKRQYQVTFNPEFDGTLILSCWQSGGHDAYHGLHIRTVEGGNLLCRCKV